MIQSITQKLQTKNVRNIPRHKVGFYSLVVIASAVALTLTVLL
jgi:hypothetical protein